MLSIKNRIAIFNLVRDIPYCLADAEHDTTCWVKAKLLGEFLTKSGLSCRVAKCRFHWEKQNIGKEVIDSRIKSNDTLISEHTFLKVLIPETKKWVNIDPTWDIGLKKVLTIAKWDGLHKTILAVSTQKVWLAKNQQGKFLSAREIICPSFDLKNHFVKIFNLWLKKARRK